MFEHHYLQGYFLILDYYLVHSSREFCTHQVTSLLVEESVRGFESSRTNCLGDCRCNASCAQAWTGASLESRMPVRQKWRDCWSFWKLKILHLDLLTIWTRFASFPHPKCSLLYIPSGFFLCVQWEVDEVGNSWVKSLGKRDLKLLLWQVPKMELCTQAA